MAKLQFLLIGALGAFTAGCATVPCDISDSNQDVLTKARCQGVYRAENEAIRVNISDTQQVNEQLRAVQSALEKEKSEVRGELQAGRAEYSALTNAMNDLLDTLAQDASGNSSLQRRIMDLRSDLANLNAEDPDASVLMKRQQLQELQDKVGLLEAELGLVPLDAGS